MYRLDSSDVAQWNSFNNFFCNILFDLFPDFRLPGSLRPFGGIVDRLGKNAGRLRLERGWTQERLAYAADLERAYVPK